METTDGGHSPHHVARRGELKPDQPRVVIVAILTPCSDAVEGFREYERKAAIIMARYGGRIERTVVEEPSPTGNPAREVHVITFPDADAFDSYRADPDLVSLADLRAASIAQTELIFGREGPDYMGFLA